jgi:RNA polymerase sigma factor (sigma-70 family)
MNAHSSCCPGVAGAADASALDPDPEFVGNGELPGVVLRAFLTANYAYLHRRLARDLGCSDRASECLHDAWLRLGDMTASEPVRSPGAYVYRTARNLAMDRLRHDRSWQYVAEWDSALDLLVDHAPGPDAIAEARSAVEAVEEAMQRLSHRHRSVLVALRIEEMTRQDVADRHCISLRRVDTALRQALDYCAHASGQTAWAEVSSPRPGPSRRWQEKVVAPMRASGRE